MALIALAAALLLAPAAVQAQQVCAISGDGTRFQSGEPGEILHFTFNVVGEAVVSAAGEEGVKGTTCFASGMYTLQDTSGGASIVGSSTWSSAPGQVAFDVQLGPDRNGDVTITIDCVDCLGSNAQEVYGADVNDQYEIDLVTPANGLLQSEPNGTVNLQVQLLINGSPANSGEDSVCWEITTNPAGDALLGPGDFTCGKAASKGFGTTFGQSVGSFIGSGQNGMATIPLAVGSASTTPVQVLVTTAFDPSAMAAIQVATVATLQQVTASTIDAVVGVPFDVEVQTVDINGQPVSGKLVAYTVNGAPLTPPSASDTTDASGAAVASFTATQAGSFPSAITATYDPTPGSTGGEQTFDFTVVAVDVVTIAKPANSGDGQATVPNQPFAQPLAAEVLRNGNPAAGESVSWQVVSGSATLSSPSSTTGPNGEPATVQVTAGPDAGPVQVRAFLPIDGPPQEVFYSLQVDSFRTLRMPGIGSGNRQSGTPGAQVDPLVAEALDNGAPAPDVAVNWTVLSGSAQLGASQTFTGADGRTQVEVTLGPQTGPVRIQAARADEPSATVVYELNVVNVDQLSIVSGADQQPVAGEAGEPLVVRFTRNGAPLSGMTVNWSVQGDASVDPAASTTDGQGLASTAIAFGTEGGNVLVQAAAGDAAPVQFRFAVEGGSGPPPEGVMLVLEGGNDQRGAPGSRADDPLVVVARNADGDPVEGVPVGWRVLSGSAVLDAAESRTGADGRASMGFRFGDSPGAVQIRAGAFSDLTFVDFSAEAFAPTLVIVSGDGQQGQPGEPLAEDFVVAIAAPIAKSLEGATVTWTVVEGDGTLAAPTTSTDAQGQARNRLTLGSSAGTYRVRAAVAGGAQVEFSATAGGDGELVPIGGDSQTLPTETFSEPLVVELRDAAGEPISGATLAWSGDNAVLESDTTVTDEQGRSSNRARVLISGPATVTVVAQDVEAEAVVFSLNAGVINTDGLDPPQREVADAIDQLCPALVALTERTPEQDDLLARCLELIENSGDDPEGVADALEEMLQDVALTQVNAALLTARAQFDNLKARIAAIRSGGRGFSVAGLNVAGAGGVLPLSLLQGEDAGSEVGADFGRWGFFASGTIGRGEVDSGSITPEYDFDTAGLTAGVDYRVSDVWIVGAALGYSRQDTELAGDSGKVDTDGWSVSGYTTWFHPDSWYLDAVLTYGSNDYELQRRIRYALTAPDGSITSIDQLASADSSGSQLSAAFSFGRDFQRGALSFGPYFRGTFTRVEFDDYSEQLLANLPGNGLGLSVDARDVDSMTSVLGGKLTYTASRDWGILMPHLSVEWEHEFQDDAQTLVMRFLHDPTQTPIEVNGDALDTDFFNVGVGLSALFPGGKSGFVYYEHLVGASGISRGNLAIGLRIEF